MSSTNKERKHLAYKTVNDPEWLRKIRNSATAPVSPAMPSEHVDDFNSLAYRLTQKSLPYVRIRTLHELDALINQFSDFYAFCGIPTDFGFAEFTFRSENVKTNTGFVANNDTGLRIRFYDDTRRHDVLLVSHRVDNDYNSGILFPHPNDKPEDTFWKDFSESFVQEALVFVDDVLSKFSHIGDFVQQTLSATLVQRMYHLNSPRTVDQLFLFTFGRNIQFVRNVPEELKKHIHPILRMRYAIHSLYKEVKKGSK